MEERRKKIVVLGGGFGGLAFVREVESADADVTLIDKRNHHLFQPLLYQVATAGLAAPDIAEPLRSIFSRKKNVEVLMDEVVGFDLDGHQVITAHRSLSYDYLVVAMGGQTNYFGNDQWSEHATGLKTLADAHKIRNEILGAFERAENSTGDSAERRRLLTSVVIGAGPTGVEIAGTLADLSRRYLRRDFRNIDPSEAKVILIDAVDRVLPSYSERLSRKAREQLESLGVEVVTGKAVKDIQDRKVVLDDREVEAENIIWTAGVAANSITEKLDTPKGKGGRIEVQPDCSLQGRPNVFAIGDIVSLKDPNGTVVPGVAPAATQMAKHVAKIIKREIDAGRRSEASPERPSYVYKDKGNMATIGRSRAVADLNGKEFSGFVAWILWLAVHLLLLVGMRNRLLVLLQWFYAYVRFKPGARIIWRPLKGEKQTEAEEELERHPQSVV